MSSQQNRALTLLVRRSSGQQEEARTQDPNEPSSAASRKRKTLEELFRPPLDLMHKGSFNTVSHFLVSPNSHNFAEQ